MVILPKMHFYSEDGTLCNQTFIKNKVNSGDESNAKVQHVPLQVLNTFGQTIFRFVFRG